jgi:cyclopropane fatty-acyl-phospholipid synthase-like methyltransferase
LICHRTRQALQRFALQRAALILLAAAGCAYQPARVPYLPSSDAVVDEMLRLAKVRPGDVVYDLGSGDGRIVIAAARTYGARGIGIELNPELIEQSKQNALAAGVSERVTFLQQYLFTADLSEATVVTLYLGPEVNALLLPKLKRELKPGARVVSHNYLIGNWRPQKTVRVIDRSEEPAIVYYWEIR